MRHLTPPTLPAAARGLALAAAVAAAFVPAASAAAQTTPTTPPSGSPGGTSGGTSGGTAGGTSGTMSGMSGMSGTAGMPAGMDSTMMTGPVLREPVAEMFTPAKIAGVASVSNMSEILPSRYALQRTQRPDVRRFAQEMIDMHTRLEQQMQAMLKAKGVTPEHNGYSYQVQSNLRPMMQQLAAARTPADFDRLYMSHQVASHMNTLNALDTSLLPNARDPEMQAMLRTVVRPAVADHYARAIALRDAVAGGQGRGGAQRGMGGASGSR